MIKFLKESLFMKKLSKMKQADGFPKFYGCALENNAKGYIL